MKLALFLASFLLACTQQPDMIPDSGAATSTYQFLSLGGSYTVGESVPTADRWPVQLARLLRNDGIDVADPEIIARTGWTTAELQAAIAASGHHKTYDLVSLLIGVNNQYRGQSQEQYQTEFRELLQTSVQFAGGKLNRVFVLSIPDWGASPFAAGRDKTKITQEIDQFNAVAQDECRKAGIAYVTITPSTQQAAGDNTPGVDSQFASDGLHYSGKQMRLWAEKALPVVKTLLTQ